MCSGELSAVIARLMSKVSVKQVEVSGSEELKKCPPFPVFLLSDLL